MNLSGKKITVHDMCLRDGMHPKRHQISLEQMKGIARGLDAAGVPLIEVTHGDGLGGASVNYGFPAHSDEEYLRAVLGELKHARVSALLLPGIGTVDHLRMAHDIGVQTHGEEGNKKHWADLSNGGYKALDELRRSGAISAIGFGVNEVPVLLDALGIGDWDVFLIANRYNLIEQTPLEKLFPECQKRGSTVIIGGPFNSGILAVGAKAGADYNYFPAPQGVLDKVAKIEKVCADHKVALPAAALQFPLTHPSVCSVIPGSRSTDELKRNLDLFRTPIPKALWSDLKSAGLMRQDAPTP